MNITYFHYKKGFLDTQFFCANFCANNQSDWLIQLDLTVLTVSTIQTDSMHK